MECETIEIALRAWADHRLERWWLPRRWSPRLPTATRAKILRLANKASYRKWGETGG